MRRLHICIEAWPACAEGKYDPRCCRFPKSCSCTVYDPMHLQRTDLEPLSAPFTNSIENLQNPTPTLSLAIGEVTIPGDSIAVVVNARHVDSVVDSMGNTYVREDDLWYALNVRHAYPGQTVVTISGVGVWSIEAGVVGLALHVAQPLAPKRSNPS